MKGILLIHPHDDNTVNFDVLIEKTLFNKLFFSRIKKKVKKKTTYIIEECPYVRCFFEQSKEEYWHLGSEDLTHIPDVNYLVVDKLVSLNLKTVVMFETDS